MVDIKCICPPDGTRHEGDTVELRERLDFRSALTCRNAMVIAKGEDPDISVAELLADLTEQYLLAGVESWSLVDAKNKALPVSKANIREYLLSHPDEAMVVGDAADELYAEAVMLPLLARAQNSSAPTPIGRSTSATNGSSKARPKPSKRSSTITSPTDAIEAISASPAGGFSS